MSEMIERMARAIHFRGEDGGDDAWNHCQPYLRDIAREQARAAIEAMREPIGDMLEPGYRAIRSAVEYIGDCDYYINDTAAPTDVWQAMLDAALASPPVEPKEI